MKTNLLLYTICFLLSLMVVPGLQAQTLQGDRWADVQKKGSGTIVCTYIETPGFAYRDPAGKNAGLCVAIMDYFVRYVEQSRKVKLTVQYQGRPDNFKNFYENVRSGSGGVFGLGNVTITEARRKEVRFSPPFVNNITLLLTHAQVPTLPSLQQMPTVFHGMVGYTIKGTTNEQQMLELKRKYYPAMKIVSLNSSPAVVEHLTKDPRAFANLDFTYYLDALREKKNLKRHAVGDNQSEEFGLIMPLNSDWAPLMNEFLGEKGAFKKSPEYKQLLLHYLGASAVQMLKEVQQ